MENHLCRTVRSPHGPRMFPRSAQVVTDAKDPEPQAAVLEELAKLIPQALEFGRETTGDQPGLDVGLGDP